MEIPDMCGRCTVEPAMPGRWLCGGCRETVRQRDARWEVDKALALTTSGMYGRMDRVPPMPLYRR